MSDETTPVVTADLKLVLRNADRAARNAAAAFEASERLVTGIGARFDAVESRLTGLELRMSSVERGVDGIARSNHRIEQMLADIVANLP